MDKINVIFRNRKAILTSYFDAGCLCFSKRERKPAWKDIKILDKYYPDMYFMFLNHITPEERMEIMFPDGSSLFGGCICESYRLAQDTPASLNEKGLVEIIGDDPLEYDIDNEYVDEKKTAHVKCLRCGKEYLVNKKCGYRVAYPCWKLIDDQPS